MVCDVKCELSVRGREKAGRAMFMLIEEKMEGRGDNVGGGLVGQQVGDVTEASNSTSAPSPALAPFPLEIRSEQTSPP
jgi:hypothetical protein